MSYLELKKQEKALREKAEADELRVKMLIMDINKKHNEHNGQFLDDLEQFLKNYEQ